MSHSPLSTPGALTVRPDLLIRPAVAGDGQLLHRLVGELAEYEQLSHQMLGTPEDFEQHGFGERPLFGALIAEASGAVAGFALFYTAFSTFNAGPTLYLEDLFVRPDYRGRGIGRALFVEVAAQALERGCARYEWQVLDWNEPSIAFYRRFGAEPTPHWLPFRLEGDALRQAVADHRSRPNDTLTEVK